MWSIFFRNMFFTWPDINNRIEIKLFHRMLTNVNVNSSLSMIQSTFIWKVILSVVKYIPILKVRRDKHFGCIHRRDRQLQFLIQTILWSSLLFYASVCYSWKIIFLRRRNTVKWINSTHMCHVCGWRINEIRKYLQKYIYYSTIKTT